VRQCLSWQTLQRVGSLDLQRVDKFRAAFPVTGQVQEMVADKETAALLERFSGDPEVQKAASEFDQAQKLEETFLKDFQGQDFTSHSLEDERANSSSWHTRWDKSFDLGNVEDPGCFGSEAERSSRGNITRTSNHKPCWRPCAPSRCGTISGRV
jgi:hypothetical protein